MSVHALSCILGNGSKIGRSQSEGHTRLVLIAIAHRADDNGFAWPKIADLAKQANVHRSTVNRNLDQLIAGGELRMFTRGHYRSPAYAMTIVDHPLSTQQIVDRLVELDPRAEWRERLVDPSGDALEIPVPDQATLNLGGRLSQSATISENDTVVSTADEPEASDQGQQAHTARENHQNEPDEKIVAERDDLPEIVAERDEIVAVARRSSEPSENHQRTTTAAAAVEETDPEAIARLWCDLRDVRFAGKIASTYPAMVRRFLEDHPPPSDEFLEQALDEGIKHPSGWAWVTGAAGSLNGHQDLPDCFRCANKRLVAKLPNGHLGPLDSPEDYDTVVHCPECMFVGREKTG